MHRQIIGTFKQEGEEFVGSLDTLGISGPMRITPDTVRDQYRVFMGKHDVGVGERTSNKIIRTLRVTIDDPTFAQPISGLLLMDTYNCPLLWQRDDPW